MSDKTMHTLAYLGLVCVGWFSISPYKKVDWRKVKVWLALAVMVWYGAFDEWLQGRIGRSADIHDFYADLAGVLFGLVILSIFNFWQSCLIISGVFIFAVTNLSMIDRLAGMPWLNIFFHFFGYAAFTLIWLQFMQRYIRLVHYQWLITAFGLPAALLASVKLCSLLIGKEIWLADSATALAAITAAIVVSYLVCRPVLRNSSANHRQ